MYITSEVRGHMREEGDVIFLLVKEELAISKKKQRLLITWSVHLTASICWNNVVMNFFVIEGSSVYSIQ